MILPHTLDTWTLEAIRRIAESGITENDVFDLKADLQSAEHQRKTIAAFANSEGGFLVFGVQNDRSVVGVPNYELPRDFGTRLVTGLEPSIEYRFGAPIRLPSGNVLFVCEVPRSKRGPHAVLSNNAWVFLKRGPSGNNEPMTYSEIRSNFLEAGRRRSYLALLRNELERIEEFGRMLNINAWSHPEVIFPTGAGQFSPLQLETLLPEVFGDLVSDPNLVSALNTVRELIHGIDSAARAVASKAAEKRLTEKDVHTHIRFLRNDPARVSGEARRALDALKKVVW